MVERGFSNQTEQEVSGRRVDLVLTLGSLVLACEISATTSAEHEFERSIRKCLQAGFARIFLVCDHNTRRTQIEGMVTARCSPEEGSRVERLTARDFLSKLGALAEAERKASKPAAPSAGKTVLQSPAGVTPDERKHAVDDAWAKIGKNMKRDRKLPDREPL